MEVLRREHECHTAPPQETGGKEEGMKHVFVYRQYNLPQTACSSAGLKAFNVGGHHHAAQERKTDFWFPTEDSFCLFGISQQEINLIFNVSSMGKTSCSIPSLRARQGEAIRYGDCLCLDCFGASRLAMTWGALRHEVG
jgi:hypothetical protein